MPTVSVVLPTYNRSDLLPRSLDSVLEQTYTDFELIVVDDGSTDDTSSVVEGYDDDRITYLPREVNGGPSAARNTGIRAANGEWVSFLDSDDELAPTFLERSLRRLRDESSNCAGTCVTYENRRTYDRAETKLNPVPPFVRGAEDLHYGLPRVGGLTIRSAVLSEVGPFDERQPYNEDVDYWLRLFDHGYYLAGIGEPLYRYYLHSRSAQQTKDDRSKIAGLETFFEKHGEDLQPDYRAQHRRDLGMAYAREGEFADASVQFRRAWVDGTGPSMNYWYYLTSRTFPRAFPLPLLAKRAVRFSLRKAMSVTNGIRPPSTDG